MRINHNINAMNNIRAAGQVNKAAGKNMEVLSSGLRINRAADDAAGLAISEKMRGQIRGLKQASRNTQDAISLIQTAEGAASTIHDMLQRARELSVQMINGTYTDDDRNQTQAEVDEIVKQIDNVANTTEFNTVKLLNATGSSSFAGVSQETLNTLTAKIPGYLNDGLVALRDNFGIALPDSPVQRLMNVVYIDDGANPAAASVGTADGGATLTLTINLDKVIDGTGNIISEGALDTLLAHEMMHALQFTEMSFSTTEPQANISWFVEGMAMLVQGGNQIAITDNNVADGSPFDGDYRSAFEALKVLHEITQGGIAAIIDRLEVGDTTDQALANTVQDGGAELATAAGLADFNTLDAFQAWFNADAGGDITNYITTSADFDNSVTGVVTDATTQGSSSSLSQDASITNGTGTAEIYTHFDLVFDNAGQLSPELMFQVGANTGQIVQINKMNLTAKGLGVDSMDVSTQTGAQSALGAIDSAIAVVSSSRSSYGAIQNRLEHTIKSLDNTSENLTSSESRIRDADIAREMMEFTKNNILSQAGQSLLSQINNSSQSVLQLLRV